MAETREPPPPELAARLQRLLRAACKVGGCVWAAAVLEGEVRPLTHYKMTATDADFAAWVGQIRAGKTPSVVSLVRPITGPSGEPLGHLLLGGAPVAKMSDNLLEAIDEFAALAGFGIELEFDRAARDAERARLSAELDHRVKNVLAAVQSVASQSAKRAVSLDGFLKAFVGRLKTMASAHELLTATRWRGADLSDIAAAELASLAPGQIRWEGDAVFLAPRAASALSLALHELAINALRHGALARDTGRVQVRWKAAPDGGFTLEWTETGGPTVEPDGRGFGRALLEDVTGRELDGEVRLDFQRSGLRAHIQAGAKALAGAAPARAGAPKPVAAGVSIATVRSRGDVRGLRVLVVEDAALLAWELDAGLTEAGAVVVGPAADVDEALGLLDQPIDAAVLDCNLNGESVRPVAEALAARGAPFLFATGYGDNQGAPEGFDAPIIRKPYEVTQIIAALIEITGRKG